jgi:O-antigen ligase
MLPLILVGALAISVTPLLPTYFQERTGSLISDVKHSFGFSERTSLTSRGFINSTGLKIWLAHPILGVGIGNFGHYYVDKDFNPGYLRTNQMMPHNIYMQALTEMGVVGGLIIFWLVIATLWNILQARRAASKDHSRWLYFGAIEMMALAIFISTSNHGNFMWSDFWLLLTLTVIARRVAFAEREEAAEKESLSGSVAA